MRVCVCDTGDERNAVHNSLKEMNKNWVIIVSVVVFSLVVVVFLIICVFEPVLIFCLSC